MEAKKDRILSPRLEAIVESLPLRQGLRVLEIGCGPGAAARAVVSRIGDGHVLAIDRSATAIRQANCASHDQVASGRLRLRHMSVEDLELDPDEPLYDLAFAVRVGVLDGRHPERERVALQRIAKALTRKGRLFIDGGNPLREVSLRAHR